MDELDVRLVSIDDVSLDLRNARKHSARNLAAIAESLSAFGQRKPIVVSQDMVVVAGNGTVAAARQLGWTQLSVAVLPWSDPAKCMAYALADNRTAELAEWDGEVLAGQLLELEAAGWGVDGLGWSARDFNRLQGMAGIVEDEPPAPPVEPVSVLGDVWLLGGHRLLVGDATDAMAVSEMAGECDLLWTDPPYGVEYVGKTRAELTIRNDTIGGLDDLLRGAFGTATLCLRPGSAVYVAYATSTTMQFWSAFEQAGWDLRQQLVWVKDQLVMGRSDYHWRHEPILYGYVPGEGRRGRGSAGWFGDDAQTTVIEVARPRANDVHPTMKPVELVARCLVNSTPRDGVVLDLFGGSGSTLMAAEQTGRSARLVELDPRYADVICARWQQHTGLLPVNQATGQEVDVVGAMSG